MVKRKHDFPALEAKVLTASIRHPDTVPNPETQWNLGYADALAQALERREFVLLIRMLDAALPIHPVMLPALADAIRSVEDIYSAGLIKRLPCGACGTRRPRRRP